MGIITDGKRIVVYDFETTGFVAGTHQIIQVAVHVEQDGESYQKCWHVQCPDGVPERITELTGITNAHCERGETMRQTAERLWEIMRPDLPDLLLIGHNAMVFDNTFAEHLFAHELSRHVSLGRFTHDTCAWTKAHKMCNPIFSIASMGNESWQKALLNMRPTGIKSNLLAACEYYGVPCEQDGHMADVDVMRTWQIAQAQFARIDKQAS